MLKHLQKRTAECGTWASWSKNGINNNKVNLSLEKLCVLIVLFRQQNKWKHLSSVVQQMLMGPACDNVFVLCLGSLMSEHSAASHFVLKNLVCAPLVKWALYKMVDLVVFPHLMHVKTYWLAWTSDLNNGGKQSYLLIWGQMSWWSFQRGVGSVFCV